MSKDTNRSDLGSVKNKKRRGGNKSGELMKFVMGNGLSSSIKTHEFTGVSWFGRCLGDKPTGKVIVKLI